MKKYILLFIIAVACVGAEAPTSVPVNMSPRRLWKATPDDVTSLLVTRANYWLSQTNTNAEALTRALEVIDIIALLDRQTLLSDEYNPKHTHVLRVTPQYLIEQFKGLANVYEQLLRQYSTRMTVDQAKSIATTMQAYRDAAYVVELNTIPKEEPTAQP